MKKLLQDLQLVDAWSNLKNDAPGFTYQTPCTGTQSRLDYIMISDICELPMENSHKAVCASVPDHSAVIVNLCKNLKRRGKGYWKMNAKLLDHKEFVLDIVHVIEQTSSELKDFSKQTIWEMIKICIKGSTMKFSVDKAKKSKTEKKQIQVKLNELEQKIIKGNNDDELKAEKEKLIKTLDDMYLSEVKGAQIRSKVKWVEEGERSSKYFFSLEKKRQAANVIPQLRKEDGELIDDDLSILDECVKFYQQLYTSDKRISM